MRVAIRGPAIDSNRRQLEPPRRVFSRQQHGIAGVGPHLGPVAVVRGEHLVARTIQVDAVRVGQLRVVPANRPERAIDAGGAAGVD